MSYPPKTPPPPAGVVETPEQKADREKRYIDGKLIIEQLKKGKEANK
jgi:hypothetical protein